MSLRFVPKSVTLNGEMAFILRYFTEFDSFRIAYCVKVVDKAVTMNMQFTITMSSSKPVTLTRT